MPASGIEGPADHSHSPSCFLLLPALSPSAADEENDGHEGESEDGLRSHGLNLPQSDDPPHAECDRRLPILGGPLA